MQALRGRAASCEGVESTRTDQLCWLAAFVLAVKRALQRFVLFPLYKICPLYVPCKNFSERVGFSDLKVLTIIIRYKHERWRQLRQESKFEQYHNSKCRYGERVRQLLEAKSADNTLCIIEHFGKMPCQLAGAVLSQMSGNCAVVP